MNWNKRTLLLTALASVGTAGSTNAAITGLINANFEAGNAVQQDVPGWFDYVNDNGDVVQLESANAAIPEDTDGTSWLNLVDNVSYIGGPRGVYQSFGTHELGATSYQINLTIGQRSDTSGFDDIIVELFYGSAPGANGSSPTSIGLTAADSKTISGSDYFATSTTKGTASVQLLLDAAAVGVGDTLWLSLKTGDDWEGNPATQSLIDDIGVGAVPEPSSLALICLGGLSIIKRRRRN